MTIEIHELHIIEVNLYADNINQCDELNIADATNAKQMSEITVYFYLWSLAVNNVSVAHRGKTKTKKR